jgi:hypothetical protein
MLIELVHSHGKTTSMLQNVILGLYYQVRGIKMLNSIGLNFAIMQAGVIDCMVSQKS